MKENFYSDYIVFVDESGDHALNIDTNHPVFVLTFCVFRKMNYLSAIQNMHGLKLDFWGHDQVVLHSIKIRKQIENFSKLQSIELRNQFFKALNGVIINSSFTVITSVIDKRLLKARYSKPYNPYELALGFCMERMYKFLGEQDQRNRCTHIIIEARGNKEDKDLRLAFDRIIESEATNQSTYPCELLFSQKISNSAGLQIADLVAYPIGRYVVDPRKENLPFTIIEKKFHKFPDHMGKGLKIFPYEASRFLLPVLEKQKAPEFSEAFAD